MGPYATKSSSGEYTSRYRRYDNRYDPNSFTSFGSLSTPTTSGKWE